eukprot:4136207-Prymnesium_polylepis.2
MRLVQLERPTVRRWTVHLCWRPERRAGASAAARHPGRRLCGCAAPTATWHSPSWHCPSWQRGCGAIIKGGAPVRVGLLSESSSARRLRAEQ